VSLQIKRIYDAPAASDGTRVLVDRLWPRGISKERAALDLWLKDVAPSSDLRTWFNHKPERFAEFSHRYIDELSRNPVAKELRDKLADNTRNLTLVYAAKDPAINHAIVLKAFIEKSPEAAA